MRKAAIVMVLVLWGGVIGCNWTLEPPWKCPIPRIAATSVDCFKCHIEGDFRLKETASDAHRVYPVGLMKVIGDTGHLIISKINSEQMRGFLGYLDSHGIKKAVIELYSPGGNAVETIRIVSLIRSWQNGGGKVETRLYGAAVSGGFMVFISGDVRLVDRYAHLMWHAAQGGSDEDMLKHIQDVANRYIASRGKITKHQIDKKIKDGKEWWMSGADAVEYGFADGFLGEKK